MTGQQGMDFFTALIDGLKSRGLLLFLSAVWTLILMAPIHCRGFTGEGDVMLNFSKSVMTKKQTYFNFL